MSGSRVFGIVVLLAFASQGMSQTQVPPVSFVGPLSHPYPAPTSVGQSTCKVYSLADLGDDPALCKWIAETIPQVIQPGTWSRWETETPWTGAAVSRKNEKTQTLTYYAPAKLLVVYHTPTVQGQVDEFLQGLRKAMPEKNANRARDAQVVPAQFEVPAGPRVAQGTNTYPVPYPPMTPKHLFHFIIRYEGEGIIDSNVVKFAKALNKEGTSNGSRTYPGPAPVPPPPPPGFGPQSVPVTPSGFSSPFVVPSSTPLRMPPADAPPPVNSEPVIPAPPPPPIVSF